MVGAELWFTLSLYCLERKEASARSWRCRGHWKAFITAFKHRAISFVTNASLTLRSQRCNYPREVLPDGVEFLVNNLSSVTPGFFCSLGIPCFPPGRGRYLSSCSRWRGTCGRERMVFPERRAPRRGTVTGIHPGKCPGAWPGDSSGNKPWRQSCIDLAASGRAVSYFFLDIST